VALAWAGYAVGGHWQTIVNGFHGPTYIIAALVVIALAIALWRYVRRHGGPSGDQHGRHQATSGRPRAGRPS
jgi:membrane protein implicated in regulation of membrane protease activity